MKAVSNVEQFIAKLLIETESKPGNMSLCDIVDKAKTALPVGDDDSAMRMGSLGVAMFVAHNLRDAVEAMCAAGKVICEIAQPEEVAKIKALMTPEELRAAADEAGSELVKALMFLKDLLPAVQSDIDVKSIAGLVVEAGRKRAEAKKAKSVKAKPVQGAANPLNKRIEPSAN